FAARLAAALPRPEPGSRFTLVDRAGAADPRALERIAALGWRPRVVVADVFDWLEDAEPHEAVVANLFLHHFESRDLARMFQAIAAKMAAFAACEPRRSSIALAGSRMLGAIGCNDVTRHDAVVSVRAGFRDGELTRLWPGDSRWTLAE